ncbi:MAG: fatty acid desaturase family protein [Erythrobacter sp.]
MGKRQVAQDLKSRASDVIFGMKFFIYLACMAFGVAASSSGLWGWQVLSVIFLGAMFAHGVELQHQVLHNQGFQDRKLNEAAGVLLGLPMLVSFAGYQASHLRHHRLLGTPENKEYFDYGDQYGASRIGTVLVWAKRFLMPAHYASFLKNLGRAFFGRPVPGEDAGVSKRIRRDHLVMLAGIGVLGALSALVASPIILLVWIAPLVLVAAPLHALIEMPEHYRCDVTSTDVFLNTRTIKSNAVMTWFTNGNNFHVEHHYMPALPIDRLHDLHAVIAKDIPNLYISYRDFYADVLRNEVKSQTPRGDK